MAKRGLEFEIEVVSPLHLGQAPLGAGEYLFTKRAVPGSALRGALAEALINGGMDPESAQFKALFDGEEALRFEPAFSGTYLNPGYPFPVTARQCKQERGGFPPPDEDHPEKYHGAFDTLIRDYVFEVQAASAAPLPFIDKPLCPHCWGGVEPAQGVYTWSSSGHPSSPGKVPLVRHTHTAINRARSVAEDGMLYTVETIEPGTVLRGRVWADESHVTKVGSALEEIRTLGRGGRRGRGRVNVTPGSQVAPMGTEERIEEFNDLLKQEFALYAQLTGREDAAADGVYFSLDLLSPAVLGDGVVAKLMPEDEGIPQGAELVRAYAEPETAGGWWQVAGLPYPTAMATAAGSVFLYRLPEDTDLKGLAEELDTLRARGIGRRRERGYGAVMACAPFHLWTAEKEAER